MKSSDFFHSLEVDKVFSDLDSSPNGISKKDADERLNRFGENIIENYERSKLSIFLKQFMSPVIYVLIFAAILAFFIGDTNDFLIIIGIVIINSLLGFWQESKAESSLKALKKLTEQRAFVFRNGEVIEIPSSKIVPGDVLMLSEGNVISADLRLYDTKGMLIDESTITGESIPVEKDGKVILPEKTLPYDLKNMALSGTVVVRGSGKGIVVKTGKNTYLASIAEKVKEKSPESPLTKAIGQFSKKYIVLLFIILFTVGSFGLYGGIDIPTMLYILVALMVSAIPEGLPIVITLVLAVGALELNKNYVLVRHLPSVETLGSATVIASDKTGTITTGKIAVSEVFPEEFDDIEVISALANESDGIHGDHMDLALVSWLGIEKYHKIRKNNPTLEIFPFDTKSRMMGSLNNVINGQKLFIKGSYEFLKEKSTNKSFKEFDQAHDKMSGNGLRVLAFGVGEGDIKNPSTWKIEIKSLIGFSDPPKEGVKGAVSTAKSAGIRVIMITGDNSLTAKKIATEVGIYSEGDGLLSGVDIEKLDDEELKDALKGVSVVSRALPEHKYRIVKALQNSGEIVAVTGDGVNDVPALKVADLGISMGEGTEAAKSVSKMVLVDNNLSLIVKAIKQGRLITENIRKVIYYLISANMGQIVLISLSIIMGLSLPLFPVQILWINMVTDGVQDKTFPFIKEESNLMKRNPLRPENRVFDKVQIYRIFYAAVSLGLINLALYFHLLNINYPYMEIVTILFTSMVVSIWFNGIQAQKEHEPFFKNIKRSITINPYIWVGVLIGIVLQLLAIYVFSDLFKTVPLDILDFSYVLITSVLFFITLEVRKWAEYLYNKKNNPIL
ncbi:ATPase, P-type (transporting), HAD superfamily, subfamily IC [Methanococcus vannielii SB]|uniref:P-type Cu(+) transporter n=1 Tax=Methanococcus vannielii (strain ATCC 35089 / DSM 1224 / JCM 13029 / OCM 148 / SB) TaxID=406327 RepID=A6URW9_METVS|nr:HAD-IC family P-type ATPase [Methanococcus vannielii]ABR55241.1 ATPase, P-type (transporting), HAD superfamily, subfamily IC [Methanococcus vannielii SB]